jgi:4-amino-4-deoxy-L-arabinose transferase-like glycosyltransferase
VITPPFQVADETAHVAYVQHLAENGEPPNERGAPVFADEEARLLEALRFSETVRRPTEGTIWSEADDDAVDAVEDAPLKQGNGGGIQSNSNQPPLYFLLGAGAYLASPSDGLLDRVALVRLVSALLAALTTLFVYLFLREVMAQRWSWTVGALAVAFQPMFGFVSGGVTPDALLFTASAALFFALARAFRHGLTLSGGLAIGAALAVGTLTKLTFLAFVPGVFLGIALLAWRSTQRRRAFPAAGVAGGLLAAAAAIYACANIVFWDRSPWGGGIETATANVTGGSGAGAVSIGLTEQLGYTWQLFAPRLPFMHDQFTYFPPYATWFKGSVGIFGWLDTRFPDWAYTVALFIAIALASLAAIALVQRRASIRRRWRELLTYLAMAAGLAVAIGFSGIRYLRDTGFGFEQARYLFPLLPLFAVAVALAAQGAGPRLGRPLGAGIVVLAIAHSAFAQLLVVGRFYG